MMLSDDAKERLKKLVYVISHRIEMASNGCRNVDDWGDPELNSDAPDGMDYNHWILEAEEDLITAIDES